MVINRGRPHVALTGISPSGRVYADRLRCEAQAWWHVGIRSFVVEDGVLTARFALSVANLERLAALGRRLAQTGCGVGLVLDGNAAELRLQGDPEALDRAAALLSSTMDGPGEVTTSPPRARARSA
jgi:hypothetical protein